MINAPLRLAVLAAVMLTRPAAAQTDAAFAAGLAKPLPGLAATAQLKTQAQTPPAPKPKGPAVPEAVWIKILNTARTEGQWILPEGNSPFGTYKLLEPTGNRAPAHTHMSVEVVAKLVTSTTIEIAFVRLVAVTLTVHAAGKRIQTWEYTADFEGRVLEAQTVVLNIAADGSVKDQTETPLDIAARENAARYDALIKYWSGN